MPDLPTTRKGAATSRRILDAAAVEFAERGIAGARMDRITAAASTNKAQLYGYFGSKDGLFDAVVADRSAQLLSAVAFDGDDLPGAAVTLYDQSLHNPDLVRLLAWIRLERRPAGSLTEAPGDEQKLAAIVQAQADGRVRAGDPFDLLVLIVQMSLAWSSSSTVWAATPGESAAEHERRRTLLRESVHRVIAP